MTQESKGGKVEGATEGETNSSILDNPDLLL